MDAGRVPPQADAAAEAATAPAASGSRLPIELIAALSDNLVIGREHELPWYIPEDLRRFRELTLQQAVIMGRVTYEGILERTGRPLAERLNIVLTSRRKLPKVSVAHSMAEALALAGRGRAQRIMIIGGARVYAEALPLARVLHLTRILCSVEGDTFFPQWSTQPFARTEASAVAYSPDNQFDYRFETWQRFATAT